MQHKNNTLRKLVLGLIVVGLIALDITYSVAHADDNMDYMQQQSRYQSPEAQSWELMLMAWEMKQQEIIDNNEGEKQ